MLARDSKPSMLLQQPGRIGPLRLRNRVIMGPMGTNFGTTDGLSTERDKIYYAERARGGAAMIITEAMVITGNARNHRASLCIFDDRFIPGLADLTKAIHQAGALVCGQLNHRGMLLRRSVLGMEPVGPSPGKNPTTGDEVRALTRHEIAEIQEQFLTSAVGSIAPATTRSNCTPRTAICSSNSSRRASTSATTTTAVRSKTACGC